MPNRRPEIERSITAYLDEHDDEAVHEFVGRDMITAGAKVLALMAIDVLGLADLSS